jgi:ribosome biogenesis GTPase
MKRKQKFIHTEKLDGSEMEGLLIAHFGTNVIVENSQGEKIRCHLRKNMESCIPGDRVLFRIEQNQTGIVCQIQPRDSLLYRIDRNKQKLIAANIDTIVIVAAPPPLLSLYLIDRYLVAAEHLKIKPIILLNKMDLLDEQNLSFMRETLNFYEKMGYPVIFSCALLPDGLENLKFALKDRTGVLVGISGVGKSSIIAALTKEEDIAIGDTSIGTGLGKHTTTSTHLYHLPEGGHLIDSPGVREFALWHLEPQQIMEGFIEFQPYVAQCKFRNCSHQTEPGCALLEALDKNEITPSRYQSYCEILRGE